MEGCLTTPAPIRTDPDPPGTVGDVPDHSLAARAVGEDSCTAAAARRPGAAHVASHASDAGGNPGRASIGPC